jgi:2-oxoglutarate dehydrogenase complex dehydrogenase (E1) component-like enzyme
MICYRRFGHNELDQPAYTQPILYNKISKHPDTLAVYEKELVSTGTCEQKEIDEIKAMVGNTLQSEFDASKDWVTPKMVRIYVYIRIYIHINMCILLCLYMYVYTYTRFHMYMYLFIYLFSHIC